MRVQPTGRRIDVASTKIAGKLLLKGFLSDGALRGMLECYSRSRCRSTGTMSSVDKNNEDVGRRSTSWSWFEQRQWTQP